MNIKNEAFYGEKKVYQCKKCLEIWSINLTDCCPKCGNTGKDKLIQKYDKNIGFHYIPDYDY